MTSSSNRRHRPTLVGRPRARPDCTLHLAASVRRERLPGYPSHLPPSFSLSLSSLSPLLLAPVPHRVRLRAEIPVSVHYAVRPPGNRCPHRLSASPRSPCLAPCCSLRCVMRQWVCPLPPRLHHLWPAKCWSLFSFPPRISLSPLAPFVAAALPVHASLLCLSQLHPPRRQARCRYPILSTSTSGMGDSKASCRWPLKRQLLPRKVRNTSAD